MGKERITEGRITLLFLSGFCCGMLALCMPGFREPEISVVSEQAGVATANWKPPMVPDSFSFAGEAVPLHRENTREDFDRELLYNFYRPNTILYIIKLANRHFPVIEERLKANGVPDDMKYLCVAESNLQQAVSKAGAAGFWQFMPGTAPAYGLEVNNNVDERYHIEKSTDAACTYLKQAYRKFGSWTAAAASYNCGQGRYNQNAGFQKTDYYYDLLLPEETNRYIFRILTFKHLLSKARELGYVVEEEHAYKPLETKEIPIKNGIPNLASFASTHGITYKTLIEHNPWLKGKSLPSKSGKTYLIKIPLTPTNMKTVE